MPGIGYVNHLIAWPNHVTTSYLRTTRILPGWGNQGLRASSLQFTSPLEFNAIFRDGFTLRHELTAGSENRDPVPAKFKHVTNIVTCTWLCCDYVTYVPALKFPKSWLRTLGHRQKLHHFFFSHKWGTRFKYLSKLCPYILMYSALHIMRWFSQLLDVFTTKIKRKFFDFYILWIKTNVAYTILKMIARTKYCTTTTASNWFVNLYSGGYLVERWVRGWAAQIGCFFGLSGFAMAPFLFENWFRYRSRFCKMHNLRWICPLVYI